MKRILFIIFIVCSLLFVTTNVYAIEEEIPQSEVEQSWLGEFYENEFKPHATTLLTAFLGSIGVWPTDTNSLSQDINTKTDSTNGAEIKVYGTNRAELKDALQDRASSPYRKLINGGS